MVSYFSVHTGTGSMVGLGWTRGYGHGGRGLSYNALDSQQFFYSNTTAAVSMSSLRSGIKKMKSFTHSYKVHTPFLNRFYSGSTLVFITCILRSDSLSDRRNSSSP